MTGAPFAIVCDSVADREGWLRERKTSIGASESASVLGRGAFQSAYALWQVKAGNVEPDSLEEREHVFWGNQLENAIIEGYAKRTGRVTVPFGLMLRSERWPWLTCTPDAWVCEGASPVEAEKLRGFVEMLRRVPAESLREREKFAHEFADFVSRGWWPLQVKNVGFRSSEDWTEGVPDYYRIQCVHEYLVCGAERTTGCALVAGQRLVWDDVEHEEIIERQVVNLTREFMKSLKESIPPAVDGSESTRRAIAKRWPESEAGKIVRGSADAMARAYELDSLKSLAAATLAKAAELENAMRAEIADAESIVFPDGSGFTLKTQIKKSYTVRESSTRVLRRKRVKDVDQD